MVHKEQQRLATEGVRRVEGVKLGPDVLEVELVRRQDQALVDQLVQELDGRRAVLQQKTELKGLPPRNKLILKYLDTESLHDVHQVVVASVVFQHNVSPDHIDNHAEALRGATLSAGLVQPDGSLLKNSGEGVTHVGHTTLKELVSQIFEGITVVEHQRVTREV